jgi:hypothetical protein
MEEAKEAFSSVEDVLAAGYKTLGIETYLFWR